MTNQQDEKSSKNLCMSFEDVDDDDDDDDDDDSIHVDRGSDASLIRLFPVNAD